MLPLPKSRQDKRIRTWHVRAMPPRQPPTSGFGCAGLKVEVPVQGRCNYLARTTPHHHTPTGVGRAGGCNLYSFLMKWRETISYEKRTLKSVTENPGSLPGCGS